MTRYIITAPERLDTTVKLPASKSISNRALMIYALSRRMARSVKGEEKSELLPQNLSDCDDTEVIVSALRDMPDVINIKAAGTAMRFMTAYLSVKGLKHVLTGTERMKHRPIGILVDALRQLGAKIEYVEREGFPPLRITGRTLHGGLLEIAGNVSSQYISALLLIGPMLEEGLTLRLKGNIISRPYIDLTLWMMREFGADADWTGADTISVRPKPYRPRQYYIENDWSASSYWYEMVALMGDADAEVRLSGLTDGSKQGDSIVRYIFSLLGVKTLFKSKAEGVLQTVTLRKSSLRLPQIEFDFTNSPDLAQTVVVCCCLLGVPFHFSGLSTLKIKETDRIEALKTELRKLGFPIVDRSDSELSWDGRRSEPVLSSIPGLDGRYVVIDTYEDHRMAMAFAPAALLQPIVVNNAEVVTKSYPAFWDDLRLAGFKVEEV